MLNITYDDQLYQFEPHSNVSLKNEGTYGNGSIDWAPSGVSLAEIAEKIGCKHFLAAKIDGKYCSAETFVTRNCTIEFIDAESADGKNLLAHTTVFLLEYAARQVLSRTYQRKEVKVADNNTLCMDFSGSTELSEDMILAQMQKITDGVLSSGLQIKSKHLPYFKAMKDIEEKHDEYLLAQIKSNYDEEEPIAVYQLGDYWALNEGFILSDFGVIKQIILLNIALENGNYHLRAKLVTTNSDSDITRP